MDVVIKHGSTNISGYVISYVREHNICSGIGTLELTLSLTYTPNINPHDTFSIYENGDFKVKYYVSDVSQNVPEGTIRLQCQDKSKYLVDYFISDQYTIDYPSYTRYWIGLFFDQAGVDYEFTTDDPGQLLSNYTVLGLQPAYDQIMMLCQLSGWYFYFDGNGTAIIGSLTTDVSSAGSINRRDIIDIKKTTDDKMLRNRAVVWGGYDPLRHQNSYASITVHTPYNYDSRDIRTMVVSNNNIPNLSSAYDIANLLIKEFAKPTIVKEITVWGARNYTLGEFLRVSSGVWSGRGLITSFSVSMDRSGLVTKVLLDERCPRLFGFFNFGDYVYVATFGDGIWKKHIRFDPHWYDFSTGLTNLEITDLHINNGIFGAVGSHGEMYRALYEEPWIEIPRDGVLLSSLEDNVPSGQDITYVEYSGYSARAIIVDKISNTIKFGVDTYSGFNTGDYFMTLSGLLLATASGIVNSGILDTTASGTTTSGFRGWILEYDQNTGELVDNEFGGMYPISYSGNYKMAVMDLENDGINDYVSVMTIGSGWIDVPSGGYNYGSYTVHQNDAMVLQDSTQISFFDTSSQFMDEGQTLYQSLQSTSASIFSVFEDETQGESDVVWLSSNFGMKRIRFSRVYDPSLGRTRVQSTTLTSPIVSNTGFGTSIKISKVSSTVYRLWGIAQGTGVFGFTVKYRDWDTVSNTVGSITTLFTYSASFPAETSPDRFLDFRIIAFETKIYAYEILFSPSHSQFNTNLHNFVDIYKCVVDIPTASASAGEAYRVNFNDSLGNIGVGDWQIGSLAGGFPYNNPTLYKTRSGVGIAFFLAETNARSGATDLNNWLISTNDGDNFQTTLIQHTTNTSDPTYLYGGTNDIGWQLTGEHFFAGIWNSSTGQSYLFNGDTVAISNIGTGTLPFQVDKTKIYPMNGLYDIYYIAKDGSGNFWTVNPQTLSPVNQYTFPSNYTVRKPFSTIDTSSQIFWDVTNTTTSKKEFLRSSWTSVSSISIIPFSQPSFSFKYGIICGKIFVDFDNTGIKCEYVDNQLIVAPARVFQVLQRDGEDFHLIKEKIYPLRTDISLSSPLLIVGSGSDSFLSETIYQNELIEAFPIPGDNLEVRDYRYTYLEQTLDGSTVGSGLPLSTQVLFVTSSGLYSGDATTFSGGFNLMDIQPLVTAPMERIETTNFASPGTFIFITTSGDTPEFWQKDNDKLYFTSYSGLPDSRATIIRVDDYI